MSDLLRLSALNVGIAAFGALALIAAGLRPRKGLAATVVGLAPAVGLALVGLCAALSAMVGVDIGLVSTSILAVLAVAALAVVARRRRWAPVVAGRRSGMAGRVLETLALVALAILSVTIVRLAVATGLDQWDGWAIWGPKAHALYAGGDIWSPVFTEPEYLMQHQEYPVLLPALEALSAESLGRFDPALIDVQAALVLVAFGWAAWALLRLVAPPALAAGASLALTGSAPLATNAGANYADTVVASFVALGLLCLFVWLTREVQGGGTAVLCLGGLFLAAAALTKSEGLLFAIAGLVTAGVVARRLRRPVRDVVVLAAGLLALPALWAIVDRLNGPGARNVDLGGAFDAEAVDRAPVAAEALLGELVDGWPVAGLAVVVALVMAAVARSWWPGVFVALWTLLSFAALVVVYVVSVNPIDWHLGTSADRVVFSIALGAATLAPALATLAWEEGDGRRASGRA